MTIDAATADTASVRAAVSLFDDDGRAVAEVSGLVFRRVTRAALEGHDATHAQNDWLYEVHWQASPVPATPALEGRWLIVGEEGALFRTLSERLTHGGCTVVRATPGDGSHYRRLVDEASRDGSRAWNGIVILAGAEHSLVDAPLEALEQAQSSQIVMLLAATPVVAELGAPLWLVTRGSQSVDDSNPDLSSAPAWALGGVIASEYPAMPTKRIDLDPAGGAEEIDLLVATLGARDREDRIALRAGKRYVARLTPGTLRSPDAAQSRRLEIAERGVLENLALVPFERARPGPGEIELRVAATGLNFRDVLNALGMYPGDPGPLGNECAGVITAVGEDVHDFTVGDEVITMVDSSFATHVIARAALTVRKPSNITFAEAATIPVAFLTAEYALIDLARVQPGERVLIHAATGGVGMAALQTRSARRRRDLRDRRHCRQTRARSPSGRASCCGLAVVVVRWPTCSVTAAVKAWTSCSIHSLVISFRPVSACCDAADASSRSVRQGSGTRPPSLQRFRGSNTIRSISARSQRSGRPNPRSRFSASWTTSRPECSRRCRQTLYPIERAESAFRFMGQGRHTGKIVITQRHAPSVRSDATYLITGGLGGPRPRLRARPRRARRAIASCSWPTRAVGRRESLARRVAADWRVGGRRRRRTSRRRHGVASCSITSLRSLPPLRGVIHAAGMVDDAMLAEQSLARFARVMAPKVAGTWHLHTLTRELPLDFFVMFSSGAALLGSPGQGNYAAANSFMDALAFVGRIEGRSALSVSWGSWADVGMAAGVSEQHRRRWAEQGLKMIRPAEGVRMLYDSCAAAIAERRHPSARPGAPAQEARGVLRAARRDRARPHGPASTPQPTTAANVADVIVRGARARSSPDSLPISSRASWPWIDDPAPHGSLVDGDGTRLADGDGAPQSRADRAQVRVSVADLLAGPTIDHLT